MRCGGFMPNRFVHKLIPADDNSETPSPSPSGWHNLVVCMKGQEN
jgi:hypothetical protein